MATSSLLGIDRAAGNARGRDSIDLGPSDSSDSGSDVAGIDERDGGDPGLPVDTALQPDSVHSDSVPDAFRDGADSDRVGSGERRSAAGDAGREAADINPDRIVGAAGDLDGLEGDNQDLLAPDIDADDDGGQKLARAEALLEAADAAAADSEEAGEDADEDSDEDELDDADAGPASAEGQGGEPGRRASPSRG